MAQQQTLEGYRLSPQQRRLWLLQHGADSSAFRTRLLLGLSGALDAVRLQRALGAVAARHEILRTGFEALPGMATPLQVIGSGAGFEFDEVNLADYSAGERRARVAAEYEAAGAEGFDYARGPLLRARLLSLTAEEHLLVLAVSSMCADATGALNLARELSRAYADPQGADPREEEPIQYADVSDILNELLEEEAAASGRDYWRQRVPAPSAQPEPPALLASHKGAAAQAPFRPAGLRLRLPAGLLSRVEELARTHELPAPLYLFTCWQAVLSRLEDSAVVRIGMTFDGRAYEGLESALGLFARSVPLGARLDPARSFLDLWRDNAELWQEAREWQDYFSWEQPAGAAAEQPFSRFCFEQTELPGAWEAGGVGFVVERLDSCFDRFLLRLDCVQVGEERRLHAPRLEYDAGLLSPARVRRLARQLETLLTNAAASPDSPVARLSITGEAERRLLRRWNNTATGDEPECLHRLFERQVERTPGSIALTFAGEELTYAELNARAQQLARRLRAYGVGPDVLVGVLLERSVEMVVSLLAVLKAGGAYVPLDPGYPTARVRFMLEDSGARVLLTQSRLRESVTETALEVVCVDEPCRDVADTDLSGGPFVEVTPENLAYVIYTSGSTGRPKGAMVTHAAITNHMRWMQRRYPLTESDRVLQKTPFSFDASVWEFYAPLLTGARLVVAPPEAHRDPPLLLRVAREEGVTILQVVPTLLRLLLADGGLAGCETLRRLFCGGEALAGALRDEFFRQAPGAELVNLYGPTETTIDATHWASPKSERSAAVPIGRPVENMRAYVLDNSLVPMPAGASGELYLGGAGLGRGYLNSAALTAERFVPDPFNTQPGARLYRTGDVARWGEGGTLEYLGRADSQVKVRGHRVELGEVERSVRRLPGVAEAAVVGQAGESGSIERLVCYVEAQAGAEVRTDELRRALLEELPEQMVPAAWVRVERMPLTPSGKIDRRALPPPQDSTPQSGEDYVAPQTEAERVIDNIWQSVLRMEKIGVHDNFFDLGGHSLLMVQVHNELRKFFKKEVSIIDMFQYPTISSLAGYLSEEESEQPSRGQMLGRADARKESRKRQREVRQEARATRYQEDAPGR